MARLFGTDGVRGVAGMDLTAELAYRLGLAVSEVLIDTSERKPRVLIGRDTRISGDMFECAIAAGLTAMGCDVYVLGVIPTPAVAYLVRAVGADAGVMISASHNSSEYNGIKIFDGNGYKLPDEVEDRIEKLISEQRDFAFAVDDRVGRRVDASDMHTLYEEHLTASVVPGKPSDPRKILVDLANGAACATAKNVFTTAHFPDMIFDFIADEPNGLNINRNCGSTKMQILADTVRNNHYALGIAFDGDTDRCLLVDEQGRVIDGDKVLCVLAKHMKAQGTLADDTFVVTCMSNMGLHLFAKENEMNIKITAVGDRYVLEEMLRGGYKLGGEQSGHVILADYGTTGDGQMTAIMCLNAMCARPQEAASELFGEMKTMPQISVNLTANAEQKQLIMNDPEITALVAEVAKKLEGRGRILLRPSGTEALVRMMLEGENSAELHELGGQVAARIRERLCGKN